MIQDIALATWARVFLLGFVPTFVIYLVIKAGASDVFLALVVGSIVGTAVSVAVNILGIGGSGEDGR
ncbi:MAG: hypothetical protein R3B97_05800 [Dehalococcoidia bacterium]|nr:hypothetical protein [Dehalococcoidia bacterium]